MDTATSLQTPPAEGAAALSEEDVLSWLSRQGYHRTHAALKTDLLEGHSESMKSADQMPSSFLASVSTPLQAELRESVEAALSAYQQLAGAEGVYALLDHWDPQCLSVYHLRRTQNGSAASPCSLEKKARELEEANARLRTRERELDTQLKQTVTTVAERLQALVTSVDPMHKDILLPLLRTVAVLGSSSTVRAAARHMMLTLYKRPMTENRMAIVQEWLRIAREAAPRSLEQELIPELYTLVNAQVFERRLLALDCAAAVAPLLRRSPQVRYSLCQGLLRPLCEDDTSAVRREVPRCLSLLWGDAAPATPSETMRAASVPSPRLTATTHPSTTAAATSAAALQDAPVSLSPSQQLFIMELLVHLATDNSSRSVRQAAQTQLCEVLYPVFLRDGVLLTQFVPLLLTVISMEATQLLLVQQRRPNRGATSGGSGGGASTAAGAASSLLSTPAGAPIAASATPGAAGVRKDAGEGSTAAAASAVSLNNVMMLVQLLHAGLRCVAAEVLHAREADERGSPAAAQAGSGDSSTSSSSASSLADTYVRMVIPTAYTVLMPLLSRMRHIMPASDDEGRGSSSTAAGGGGGGHDASTQLCGPLCALCATLASLVPLLGASAFDTVVRYLKSLDVAATGEEAALHAMPASLSAGGSSPLSTLHVSSQSPQELQRGRLLFVCSFFLYLSGDAATLPHGGEEAAPMEPGVTGGIQHSGDGAADAPVSLSPERIREESLAYVAQRIRLTSANLASPRSPALTVCVQCIASLTPFASESHEVASGIVGLLRFLVASADVQERLTAVVLVHDTCAVVVNERLKVHLLIEPLLPLLEDPQPAVQEAALTGILSVAIALTEPRAQEKTIRPVLRVAESRGCTSRFTRSVLHQWDQLMQRMPAEPREALLYPQLAELMDRLAEQYVERVSLGGAAAAPVPPAAAASPQQQHTESRDGASGTPEGGSIEDWEATMLALHGLLHSILRCAVVTPTLVARFLLPGIQQLASEGVLSACSANVRTRWVRLLKSYLVFIENNTGRFATFANSNPNAGTLLDRVKDELKRRL